MNRLILIGNGFDLAHGLKTSYKDFIHGYLRKAYEQAYVDHKYQDDFIIVQRDLRYPDFPRGVSGYLDKYFENDTQKLIKNQPLYEGRGDPAIFSIQFISTFFNRIVTNCIDNNWVDIENEFYEDLKNILHVKVQYQKLPLLKELNNAMKFLIEHLEEYLGTIATKKHNPEYDQIFQTSIKPTEIVEGFGGRELDLEDTLILNFNYTTTIENYCNTNNNPKSRINYIHGKLGSKENDIIFGFGDELDDDYLKMELEKTRGFLKYIKSFGYFKTSNYYNLIRFIDSKPFQVFILGHSCGLSDRTMLNMIFEHTNCKSIKIFYHGDKEKNNYTALTQEISRHFKNKGEMRRKIVSFDKSEPMPQVQ
jgi:hypothetical protein